MTMSKAFILSVYSGGQVSPNYKMMFLSYLALYYRPVTVCAIDLAGTGNFSD